MLCLRQKLISIIYNLDELIKAIGLLLLICATILCNAQKKLTVFIKDFQSHEPLIGATGQISGSPIIKIADSAGIIVFSNIPDGRNIISFRFVGYIEKVDTIFFSLTNDSLIVLLKPADEELAEVVITSTRSNRSIRNIPTRVEFLNGEELEEKGNMKPGDIRMMLNESTGIQTQQISATSANSSIRIQGLDGRYTQILKDGFPLYGGFSGGLGLLQTPPLDLKQVEIIKGSTSTLFGGGAIAGMINLISKSPTPEKVITALINATSAGGIDVNGFYSQQVKKVGLTIYGGYSSNKAYDPSSVGFSAIPKFHRFVFNPKLFIFLDKATTLSLGFNVGLEDRMGGDMQYLNGHGDSVHAYYEQNKSLRLSSQLSFNHQISEKSRPYH